MLYHHNTKQVYDNFVDSVKNIKTLKEFDLVCDKRMSDLRDTYGVDVEFFKTQTILSNMRKMLVK